ncbi:MAG: c-type cytochrome [Pseudomonadales bacterium]|nr:c-type cytochrome [Pseudomonadales bacterium]
MGKFIYYQKVITGLIGLSVVVLLSACGGEKSSSPSVSQELSSKIDLGENLFSDTNLSLNRSQSCASCHDPDHAFVDSRQDSDGLSGAVSVGDDGVSIGDRNAQTAAYAQFSPDFHYGDRPRFNSQESDYSGFLGGQFHDGRELDLAGQAEGPPTNPLEMGMPDRASVVDRVLENEAYKSAFESLFGADLFADVDAAYAAIAECIAEFEGTGQFAEFDSKYDRSLVGEASLSLKEAFGKALFFSQTNTNCATCHQLRVNGHKQELFTSFEYHNIGVPINHAVRDLNGASLDEGLLANPLVEELTERGKFKVPTLRNVAVTEPYMHNGLFRDLETVIKFYDQFHVDSLFPNNPETGVSWQDPEIEETVNREELTAGHSLDQDEVEALVCFLRTLTDARYEHRVQSKNIGCED